MFALNFAVMWAHTSTMHVEQPMQFFSEEQCKAVGVMLEAAVPQRHAGNPRGQPTAIHWWCVETDEGGVI